MTRIACFLCMDGHYFAGSHCPLDGWASEHSIALSEAVKEIELKGISLSLSSLKEVGLSKDAIRQTIVVEFDAEHPTYDLLIPQLPRRS